MASTSISKTYSSAGNRQKWTWSAWIKRSSLTSASNGQTLWNCEGSSASDNFIFQIDGGGGTGGPTDSIGLHTYGNDAFRTIPLLRDTSGWYHIVLALDTTQATATNRIKLYVNGVLQLYSQETNFPTQNYEMGINRAAKHCIGSHGTNANYYFDGYMSHIHFCDGYQYAASDFGETDSNGVWKIKTAPSVSYGTNGFFILKDGNSLTDQSGNGKNLSVAGGTLTKTEDNPSNVFATLNPLGYAASANYTLANGNTAKTTTGTTNAWRTAYGTMGASSGKYYWEIKITGSESSDLGNFMLGIVSTEQVVNTSSNSYFTQYSHGYGYHAKTGNAMNNTTSSGSSYGASITTNNILGVAMDLDNNKLYFSKDGVFQNSGVPTSGSTGTGAAFTLASDITYLPAFAQYYGAERYAVNFGNGFFETTEITTNTGTGYQDEDNNGRFYYDPPTNYRCLSTKGLNQ